MDFAPKQRLFSRNVSELKHFCIVSFAESLYNLKGKHHS